MPPFSPATLLPASLLALLAALPAPAAARDGKKTTADEPAAGAGLKAARALYDGVRTATLDNGLRVYLKPVPGAATVTTMVAYRVGSADEALDHTGLAHYLEHLMFKGTDKIRPGDIDRLTQRNGGRNNASTSEDMTVYHFDFAADRWEAALAVEADRMRNLRVDAAHEFNQEKGAVINELMRDEDEPWDLEQKAILPLLFGKTSPYGHPVIGERQHVRDATARVIKGYYDTWYHPNNAALVVCGGFDPDKALAKIKELFGPIPAGKLPERKPAAAAKRDSPVRKDMASKFEVPRLLFGYNGVRGDDPDAAALSVLQVVLSGGKTSRLYRKLVEGEQVAGDVSATNSAGRYPGWFSVQVELLKGKDPGKVEKLVLEELRQVREAPVSDAEVRRAHQGIVSGTVFARESVHGLAESIAQGVTTYDLEYLRNYLPRILAVTAADVQRVAKKYLNPETRVVVRSIPGKGERIGGAPPGEGKAGKGPNRAGRRAGDAAAHGFSLAKTRRVELPNGLVLLLFEDHRLPVVFAQASVKDIALHQPADKAGVATLTGSLLDEGTADHSGAAIAELIEDVGGNLSMSASGGSVQVLSPNRKLGLSLLFECLSRPNFPKESFDRKQEQQLSSIEEAEAQPAAKAVEAFKKAVYGPHPFGLPSLGTRKTVEKLTPADCAAFHRRVFVPNNTLVAVVGDFNADEVASEIKALTADWKQADLSAPKPPVVEKPKAFAQRILSMPEAAQLHFLMGHVGVRRADPDYYKLLVMDNVLGTGPGFTDRLSARLRDREGLAYTVNANITSTADAEPGSFTCFIGTDAENFARVKKEFLEELNRIRDEKPTAAEVGDAKKYLLGSLPFQTTTGSGVAGLLLAVERFGLGLNYLDDYRKAVAAVTPEDVQAVARKHIDPKRMVLVAAGAVDSEGKPLRVQEIPPPKKP